MIQRLKADGFDPDDFHCEYLVAGSPEELKMLNSDGTVRCPLTQLPATGQPFHCQNSDWSVRYYYIDGEIERQR